MNSAHQFRKIDELYPGTTVRPTPHLEITSTLDNVAWDFGDDLWKDETPTGSLPILGIDQQPTWILPVIPGSSTAKSKAVLATTQGTGKENYLSLIRGLIKNSGIYAISSLASPLVSLLLAPFLTHTLARADYGALAILITVVALATGVTELGLGSAFMRMYAYDCKTHEEQLSSLSTLTLLLAGILLPVMLAGLLFASRLSVLLLGNSSYTGAVQVAVVLVFSQNLTVPGLVWLRAESRAAFFTVISVANLLMTAGTSIVLVGMLHLGIVGALLANGLGDVIIIAFTLPLIFWRAGFHLSFVLAGSMLAFGVPNVMNLISGWVLQLSDRYLLGHFGSLSLAAGYSVAYSLGGVLSAAIIAPFSLAWWVVLYPIAKREDALKIFQLIFRGFSFTLLFAALGLSFFGASVLTILFPASYSAQSPIIPIIALSIVFNGMFIVINLGTSLKRKTWMTSLYFLCSALINIGLNIILIPTFGTMGAAIATLAAYVALALIAYLFNQLIYPVPFEINRVLIALAIGVAFYLVSNFLTQPMNMFTKLSVQSGVILLYGLCLLLLGGFLFSTKMRYVLGLIKRKDSGT